MEEARVLLLEAMRELPLVSERTARLVLALLVASGLWVAIARSWTVLPALLLLATSSVIWLRVDQRDEGEILFVFTPSHGVTSADLAVPAVVGGALLIRGVRRLSSRRPQ